MKKLKILFTLLIILFLIFTVYKNLEFFLASNALSFNVHLSPFDIQLIDFNYKTPEISNALYFIGCFIVGLVLAYFSLLKTIYKSKKGMKDLTSTINEKQKEIAELTSKLNVSKEPVEPEMPKTAEAAAAE